MFAPGLAPGRTLSASDVLWSAVPWDASRPADMPPLGSNLDLQDAAVQFLPALQATARRCRNSALDPYTLGGRSLLGDPQSAVFSPFSVPSYVLPFWKSLAVAAMLKLFVAALGAFLLRARSECAGGALHVRTRVRLQPLDGQLGVVAARERLGVPAVALPAL